MTARLVARRGFMTGNMGACSTKLPARSTLDRLWFLFTVSAPAPLVSCGARTFDVLAKDFRVYAFDLLGFGFSDKPAAAEYSADLYVELISDFLREVSGYPANVIASSLGAAYAIRVADEHPELFEIVDPECANGR